MSDLHLLPYALLLFGALVLCCPSVQSSDARADEPPYAYEQCQRTCVHVRMCVHPILGFYQHTQIPFWLNLRPLRTFTYRQCPCL